MPALARSTVSNSNGRRQRRSPAELGLPDPRPLTDYTVALSTVAGHSRLTVTLQQPCVIRQPNWPVIDCASGSKIYPTGATVVSTVSFYLDFAGLLFSSVGFVEAPYQDMQVQNFQGGFVVPGGKWFRAPT